MATAFSVAVALLFSTLHVLVPGASAAGTSRAAAGVNFHAMWSQYTDDQRRAVLDKLAAAGVQWVRVDMGWSSFEYKAKGVYEQWYVDRADLLVQEASSRGLKVLAMVHRTPGWANDGQSVETPPNNPRDYGDFTGWLAARFEGRISAYEIWNEPDLSSFWTGTKGQYVDLLKAAYPAIKASDPAATVLIGGTTYNNTPWLSEVLKLGAESYFDVTATHPYMGIADQPPETPDTDGKNIYLMDHVAAVHDLIPDKPIWFTEFGWSSHDNVGDEKNWDRGVTEEQQADYLVRAFQFVQSKHPYVAVMLSYNERDEGWSTRVQNRHYGLFYEDLSSKPAYVALASYLTGGVVTDLIPPKVDGLSVTPRPVKDQGMISLTIDEPAELSVTILNSSSKVVVTFPQASVSPGPWSVPWDRRNDRGELVPAGSYRTEIRAVDAAGNAASASVGFSAAKIKPKN